MCSGSAASLGITGSLQRKPNGLCDDRKCPHSTFKLAMKNCVRCSYALRGLPACHVCPECGLAYDELSEIWRTKYNTRLIGALALASLGWLWLVFFSSNALRVSPLPPTLLMLVNLGFAAIFVLVLYRFWRLYRGGQFVATMPTGLFIREERPELEVIAWSNISRAAVKASPLGAVIFMKKEKTVRDIVGPFRKRSEAEDFVRHVEARLAALATEP